MKMGLREANQNFSKAIKVVRAGGVVVLTERGRPIATIAPVRKPSSEEEAIKELREFGLLQPAQEPGRMRDWKPLRVKGASLSKTLRESRDED